MNNIIEKRIYYAIDIELASPMNTSSGISESTDSDLLKNSKDEYFIPGTSIAGALRARLIKAEDEKELTGYSSDDDGKMSSLWISDLYLSNGTKSVRDGVKLNEGKTVENKFDMEVLETGATGTIYLSYIIRTKSSDKENIIKVLITDIEKGYIRFGANKNRGFGRLKVLNIYRQEFTKKDIESLLEFDSKCTQSYCEKASYEEWERQVEGQSEDYVKISVPLKLSGGISIRKYSSRPNESDFEQITIANKDENGNSIPVVPGTSWNGAIRADVYSLLKELGDKEAKLHVDQWFGYVDLDKKNAKQSIVIFGESQIKNSVPLTITRNKINRFDASTIDGALYTERSYFGGNTTLEIMVKKDVECHFEALIGVLQIVIKDIQNGYVAIGGQTAVGRGIFEIDENREIQYQNADDEVKYARALFSFIEEGK